jgi:hypothetical protein
MSDTTTPLHRCLDEWHRFLRTRDVAVLDELLHDDCVFISPVVFTPQRGKEVTKLYLTAAGKSLGGGSGGGPAVKRVASSTDDAGDGWDGRFRYIRTVREANHAVLEFETTVAGKYVNGVDLITCDDDGRIVEFKVMLRPLQAVNAVHEQMRAMLESLSAKD